MTGAPRPILVERAIGAPIDEVYAAWTTPELMARGLSPTGRADVEADVRVGGRFRVVMIDSDTRLEHHGEYVQLDPPSLLVFTWVSEYTGPEPSVVTVRLSDLGESTLVRVSHDGLPGTTAASHAGGWTAILERLDEAMTERAADGR